MTGRVRAADANAHVHSHANTPAHHPTHTTHHAVTALTPLVDALRVPLPPAPPTGSPTSSAAADVANVQARALVEIDVTNAMADAPMPGVLLGTGKSRGGRKGVAGDGAEVFRVGTTSGALSKRQEAIVAWVQSLGVPVVRNEGSTDEQSGAKHQRQARISTHTLAVAVM